MAERECTFMSEQEKIKEINNILKKYKFNNKDGVDFWHIINPIFFNENFQRRMEKDFPHHDDVSLGHHIVSDAAVTYKICQKKKYMAANIDKNTAVIIAMMHDLYTLPWQNNPENFQEYSFNGHGYRHPIEAIVNSIDWFPEYFEDKAKAEKIIDGVIHHMFPFPVRAIDGFDLELKNTEAYDKIPEDLKQMIIESSNRGLKIKHFSLCPSKFKEGRIMSFSDKKVAIIDDTIESLRKNGFKTFRGITALKTGANKNLDGYEEIQEFRKHRK